MRIGLVVQGRFHAFELANALIQRGHAVHVMTNYPAVAAEKFGLARARVTGYPLHGVLSRAAWKLRERAPQLYLEAPLHRMFARWAAGQLAQQRWDVVHPWSSVAYECLTRRQSGTRYLLMRGSAHIRAQAELLAQEQERTGARQEQPSPWMIAREESEYALADEIVTLSTFARRTFLERGFDAGGVANLPLAADVAQFRPLREIVAARCARILAGEPLRVLFVGALSYRKGLYDFAAVARALPRERFVLRCVGPATAETRALVGALQGRVEFVSKQPQAELPGQYAWGDVFLNPTIEDGFGLTMAQARAGALPILSTLNSAAPDMIIAGATGQLVPVRSPERLVEQLMQWDAERAELAAMVQRSYGEFQPRDWDDVARDFETLCDHTGVNPVPANTGAPAASGPPVRNESGSGIRR